MTYYQRSPNGLQDRVLVAFDRLGKFPMHNRARPFTLIAPEYGRQLLLDIYLVWQVSDPSALVSIALW